MHSIPCSTTRQMPRPAPRTVIDDVPGDDAQTLGGPHLVPQRTDAPGHENTACGPGPERQALLDQGVQIAQAGGLGHIGRPAISCSRSGVRLPARTDSSWRSLVTD
jgi:hypothetical protein